MLKFLKLSAGAALIAFPLVAVADEKLGLGRAALPEEIAAWDTDIRPDGSGLPPGSGDVLSGESIFSDKCASCHGDFAEGVDNWPVLAGGFDTLGDKDPVKTVGSYWPYLSTVWDYVKRSMPFGEAQSLTDDEVYAIVAYILYSNDLVDEDFVLSDANFADFEMYNAKGFVIDDRPKTEYSIWRAEPCMKNCKESVEITMRASVLDVTPDETANESEENQAVAVAESSEADVTEAGTTASEAVETELSPELVASGKKVFRKCKACHQVGANAKNSSGPHLNDILGRKIGSIEGFRYSKAFRAAADAEEIWDMDNLVSFLTNPRKAIKGTKMSFSGLKKQQDIDAVIAYLMSLGEGGVEEEASLEFVVPASLLTLQGDREYGEYLSSECMTCHLNSGRGMGIPNINNKPSHGLVTALYAYREGYRENQAMNLIAKRLADEEIAALARYFSTIEN